VITVNRLLTFFSMRRIIPILISFFLVFSGCKNDIDLLTNYKNIIVTYALLDPADSVHYVRLSKVFLGAGNALVMAQNADSIGFRIGTVDVKIQQWKNGVLLNTYQLYSDTTIPRDPGTFHYPYQVLYRGAFPVMKDGSTYKLSVVDLIKGTTLTAETPIVQDVIMVNPQSNFTPLNLWDTTNFNFKFKSGTFGKRYIFKLRFHYTEQFISDTTQTSQHYIDWNLGEQDAQDASGNELMTFNTRRDHFLDYCREQIPANVYVRRISGKIDLIFLGAAQELATYIDVGNASSNSTAALPLYTNTVGGYGLFSSRTTTSFLNYLIDSDTQNALIDSQQTQGLNFVR